MVMDKEPRGILGLPAFTLSFENRASPDVMSPLVVNRHSQG